MRSAPPVDFSAGRSAVVARALGVIFVFTAAIWLQYCLQSDTFGVRQGGMAVLAGAVFLLALASWFRTVEGTLRWDGESWTWQATPVGTGTAVSPDGQMPLPATLSSVVVRLDLQRYLLVECSAQVDRAAVQRGAGLWLWLEKSRGPLHWLALRRALFARVRRPGQSEPVVR